MKQLFITLLGAATLGLASCNQTKPTEAASETTEAVEAAATAETAPDMGKVKADIQALEAAWATADNERNATAIAAFYADDAVSMSPNEPAIVGKAAIMKNIEASLAKKVKGQTVTYETVEVFGDDNLVTEIGTAVTKDANGKTTGSGKYMAVWEKRDGNFICIRDIYNDDQKVK